MNKIRVIIADDHALLRQAVGALLARMPDIEVIATVAGGEKAVEACIAHKPDVLMMDVEMPGLDPFAAAQTIRARSPQTKLLIVSGFLHDRYIRAALDLGAMGYLSKNEPPEALVVAVRDAYAGRRTFSEEVRARLVRTEAGYQIGDGSQTRASTLTDREVEVLRYVAQGMSKKEIAATMHLSVKTVDNHVANIMKRLDLHDRVALSRFAIREGLISP